MEHKPDPVEYNFNKKGLRELKNTDIEDKEAIDNLQIKRVFGK